MTARDTYTSSVKSAAASQVVTVTSAETTRQESVNASGVNVGYNLQTGNYANYAAAVKAANIAKFNSLNAAEAAKQATVAVARDTLKATGDLAPA